MAGEARNARFLPGATALAGSPCTTFRPSEKAVRCAPVTLLHKRGWTRSRHFPLAQVLTHHNEELDHVGGKSANSGQRVGVHPAVTPLLTLDVDVHPSGRSVHQVGSNIQADLNMRNLSGCPPDCRVQRFHPAHTPARGTRCSQNEQPGEKDRCQIQCLVQRFHPARTRSKQNTLLTEIEISTKHQGEKDTGILCSKGSASGNSEVASQQTLPMQR